MKLLLNMSSVLFLLLSGAAFAFPEAPVNDLNFKAPRALFARDYDFSAIVKLSNCSGALVIYEGQDLSAKGKVLTNGHCVPTNLFGGMVKPGQVIVDKPVKRSMGLFNSKMKSFSINATKIIYATMTDTDMALYELSESYDQILKRTGVAPLVVSSRMAEEGTPIEVISGYWETGYSCAIDKVLFQVQEGNYFFKESIRYTDGCNTKGGTSGSPIVEPTSREVIGVNNSSNDNGARCTMNNPCEIDEMGNVLVLKGKKYGQQVYQIYSCLNASKEFDLSTRGCVLPK